MVPSSNGEPVNYFLSETSFLYEQELIRFPNEIVVWTAARPLSCRNGSRLFLDYEAFEVDGHGRLAFTRTFGREAQYAPGAGAAPHPR